MFPFRLLPTDNNKIVFYCYNGKGYGDNPKYIAEEIVRQNLPYKLRWIVKGTGFVFPHDILPVRIWTLRYIYELATAKIIISNVKNYLPFVKRKNQYFIQTWHGPLPFKYIEKDAVDLLSPKYVKESQQNSAITDVITSCNSMQSAFFKHSFWYDGEVLECGAPRSDIFFSAPSVKEELKHKMGVDKGQKIMLYCPTFRDNGSIDAYSIDAPMILDCLEKKTGCQWVLFVRMHPNDMRGMAQFSYDEHVVNMTTYPDMQELLLVADAQITDYSSTIAEFLVMQKPVFIFASDLDEYSHNCRGLSKNYFDLPLKINKTNDELVQAISQYDEAEYKKSIAPYMQRYNSFDDGHASERVVERIKSVVNGTFQKPDNQ